MKDLSARVHLAMYGREWRFFHGRSQDPSIVEAVRAYCPSFDLIFIDGDHSFDGVAADFELYRTLLSDRGVILFHDVDPEHVFGGGLGGDVHRFWAELDVGSKTMLYTTRSNGQITVLGERERFGGFGIWKP
jgi:hypothetical protein